jgi:hypothetical protein
MRRFEDLADQYLAQTWLLGHHGDHFKLTPDGTLKFSDLIRGMVEAGCIPLWLNPETRMVLTAWSAPDDYGPTPPRSDIAYDYAVVRLDECTLTPGGLRTPMLDVLADAAERRKRAAYQRRVNALRAVERRRQHWHESEARTWVLDRHDGHLPAVITDRLPGDSAFAEKLDLIPEHWKALAYRCIVSDEQTDWVTYKSILAALARGKHRGLDTADFNALDAYLRRLRAAGEVTLLTSGRLHISGARTANLPASRDEVAKIGDGPNREAESQGAASDNSHVIPHLVAGAEASDVQVDTHDDRDATGAHDRPVAIQSAALAEAIDVTRRSRWRLRRSWLRWH